jgi:hypothetical protein
MRAIEPIIRNTRISILEVTAQFIEQYRRNLKQQQDSKNILKYQPKKKEFC